VFLWTCPEQPSTRALDTNANKYIPVQKLTEEISIHFNDLSALPFRSAIGSALLSSMSGARHELGSFGNLAPRLYIGFVPQIVGRSPRSRFVR
jgi:hypothetical protein